MADPRRVAEILADLEESGGVLGEKDELDEKVEELVTRLEKIASADDVREVIAGAARLRLLGKITPGEEKTFREASLGTLKAIEVAARTGGGSQLTRAAEAITKLAELEESTRENQRRRARGKKRKKKDDGPDDDGSGQG